MNIIAKRERAGQLAREMNEIVNSKGRAWTKQDQARFDNLAAELDGLRAEIGEMEAAASRSARAHFGGDEPSASDMTPDGGRIFRAGPSFVRDVRDHFRAPVARNGMSAAAEEGLTLANWMSGIANGGRSKIAAVQNALTVGTDTAGGFSVPTTLMPGWIEALAPASSLLTAGAGLLFPEAGAKAFNFAAVNALPTAAWRSENGAVAASDPTFRNVQAVPRSLAFQVVLSRELLADGQNLEGALYTAIGQAFAKEIDRAGLRGSGTAPEPRGILNTAGIQAVTNGANGASLATTRYANVFSALQAVLQADAPMSTAAIMSPRSRVTLAGLLDTTNQPMAVPPLVSDLKLITTSQIPNNLTVGTSTDCSEIYVGDFSKVIFVIRERPSIQLANELYAATGQVAFICHARVDVIVEYPQALSVITGVRP